MSEELKPADNLPRDDQVSMGNLARFVRQLSHDLRNSLNAAELQSAYLNEVAEDPELKAEVGRLRAMLSSMGGSLQKLTTSIATVKLTTMPYRAADFLEDLQAKIATEFPEQSDRIDWEVNPGEGSIEIDPQLLQGALLELFANAFHHKPGTGDPKVTAEASAGEFHFTLREPKTSPIDSTENWGRVPFQQVRHGHYGLGLYRTRTIIEAHRGQFSVRYDSPASSLITTFVLPLAAAE